MPNVNLLKHVCLNVKPFLEDEYHDRDLVELCKTIKHTIESLDFCTQVSGLEVEIRDHGISMKDVDKLVVALNLIKCPGQVRVLDRTRSAYGCKAFAELARALGT
jgi:hypothetical protein